MFTDRNLKYDMAAWFLKRSVPGSLFSLVPSFLGCHKSSFAQSLGIPLATLPLFHLATCENFTCASYICFIPPVMVNKSLCYFDCKTSIESRLRYWSAHVDTIKQAAQYAIFLFTTTVASQWPFSKSLFGSMSYEGETSADHAEIQKFYWFIHKLPQIRDVKFNKIVNLTNWI